MGKEAGSFTPPPSDDELSALIKPLWLAARPGREAQSIRGVLSNAFDDPRLPGWASDYIPDYVWDLVDIAAQRGIELGRKGGWVMSEMVERVARALWDAQSTRSGTWDVLHPSKQSGMRDRARAAIGAMREPSEAMFIASEPWLDADNAAGFWRVMIDAAQSDG